MVLGAVGNDDDPALQPVSSVASVTPEAT